MNQDRLCLKDFDDEHMKSSSIILFLTILFVPLSIQARVDILCKVSYKTKKVWSEQVLTQVTFMGGMELASKTGSSIYLHDENYLLVWFNDGDVAIAKLISTLEYLIRIESIEKRHIRTMFNTINDYEAIQVNSNYVVIWNVECKDKWFYDKRFQ